MTKRVRYTIEGPADRVHMARTGTLVEWLEGAPVSVTKEEVRTKGVVGPFDPDADYPNNTLVLSAIDGAVARLRAGSWMYLHAGASCSPARPVYWSDAQVVWIPK